MQKNEEKQKIKSNWGAIVRYYWMHAKKYKAPFFIAFISYTIAVLADSVVVPYLYRNIIDGIATFAAENGSVLPSMDSAFRETIMGYVGLMVTIFIVERILFSIADYSMSRFQTKAMRDIVNFGFKKTINHSYQFFINSFAGSLVKKNGRFVNSFEDIADISMYNVWLPTVRLISIFIVLFIVAPFLGALFFFWTVVFMLFSFHLSRKRLPLDLAEAMADSNTGARTADVFSSVLNLKMFSSRDRELESFNDVATEQMDARSKAWSFQNFSFLLQGSLVTWLQMGSLYVSIVLWFNGQISLGTIVLAYSYSSTIFDSVWNLGKQMTRLSKSFSNASEMMDIIDSPIEILDPKEPEVSKIKEGGVVFEDVLFMYKNGIPILENFNLEIAPGEKLGVVGTSGAGKTTLTKLLLRFADVTEGSIKIDGQDIRNVTQDDLRTSTAYVPQDPILFHRTLRENIAYGKPDATDEEIVEAAKQAHAHEFIQNLSHGYETLVGERGVKLSGGERQRVAIARAILKNAPILILDEATSSLDSVSESHIKDALDVLMKGRTTIVIAHRLSTIEKMDRIIVMEKGKIIEEGNHRELIQKEGAYHNFWSHQQKGFIK